MFCWYPVIGDWEALGKLLKKYRSDYATDYFFTRCLINFRTGLDDADALAQAFEANPYVPKFLTDETLLAAQADGFMAGFVTTGSQGEAHAYAKAARSGWQAVPGSIEWLLKSTKT